MKLNENVDDEFITVDHTGPCFVCGRETNTIEINYQCWLHIECESKI